MRAKHNIIWGERRFRALNLLLERGEIDKDFPVKVEIKADLSADEILRMATVENVQRENLTPLEEAYAIQTLIRDGEKFDNIVSQTGLIPSTLRRRLMLLELSDEVTTALIERKLSLAQAESFAIGSHEEQNRVISQVIAGAPNTRIMPPITAPAILHRRRPNIAMKPKKMTPIIAMIRAHELESRFCTAVRKFVPESNRAV